MTAISLSSQVKMSELGTETSDEPGTFNDSAKCICWKTKKLPCFLNSSMMASMSRPCRMFFSAAFSLLLLSACMLRSSETTWRWLSTKRWTLSLFLSNNCFTFPSIWMYS
eukprot:Lithocolla_globosa_v1_NODE_4482_length_1424_cov_5.766983.p2 type:complete len:110 gc:universal NODE_4482_length_1424_cov_5.766983:864-535(-)